jgi:hypothetical protein
MATTFTDTHGHLADRSHWWRDRPLLAAVSLGLLALSTGLVLGARSPAGGPARAGAAGQAAGAEPATARAAARAPDAEQAVAADPAAAPSISGVAEARRLDAGGEVADAFS